MKIQDCAATVMELMLRVRTPYQIEAQSIYFSRRMGRKLEFVSVKEHSICPDIYHPAVARDGLLTRLRIPGGVLNGFQCAAVAELLDTIDIEYIQVTNRANLQLRGLARDLDEGLLAQLADCGLAASNSTIDGIRNIMLSPTAGIDESEYIDVIERLETQLGPVVGVVDLALRQLEFSHAGKRVHPIGRAAR